MRVSGKLRGVSYNRAEGGLGDHLITEVVGFCEDFFSFPSSLLRLMLITRSNISRIFATRSFFFSANTKVSNIDKNKEVN